MDKITEQEIIKKHYQKIASMGGTTTALRYGTEYMAKLGRKAMKKRWGNKKRKSLDITT